jgi:hypothetical protein
MTATVDIIQNKKNILAVANSSVITKSDTSVRCKSSGEDNWMIKALKRNSDVFL